MASQRQLVEQLFEVALTLDSTEREAYLNEACGSDWKLRSLVEELLAEDARAGSFLQHPPLEFLRKGMNTASVVEGEGSVNGDEIHLALSSAMRLKPGQTLNNRFEIVRFIAKGGMGEVYEVEDRFLQGVHVAMKTILPHIAGEPVLQQHFAREVLLARRVTHPNLCPIYDIFHCDQPAPGFLFLTMKLLPGETLAARLRGPKAISMEEGLAILRQMAIGLAAIHDAGIVHRDIKPNNVMLDGSGPEVRVCITDFGLARAYEGETTLTGKGMVAGTPDYLAPELFLGHPPTQASDLFAFGVVLHEIFAKQKPMFTPDSSSVIVSPQLSTSDVPPFCVQLVTDCLAVDPTRRCRAFEHALEILDPRPVSDRAAYRTRELWTRRRFAGVAAATVCAAAGGAWWKWDAIENLLHPLPGKRFVALLNWPKTSNRQVAPMLTGLLSAIKSELARAERFDQNFFVISPEDLSREVSDTTPLRSVCDPLGANLALAASGSYGSKHFEVLLRLLDLSGHPLREKSITCALSEMTSMPAKAVQAAASLLNLSRYLASKHQERMEPGTQTADAFTAYQSAEGLMEQPGDAGLDAAIEKYKQAVQLDPRYAMAHAKLALAYVQVYGLRRDSGALELARGNSERALELDRNLVDGHLARAYLLEQTGNEQGALDEFETALKLDPSNPQTLLAQAQVYTRLNRWVDAEKTYHRVLKDRPNSWVTYNELGLTLDRQAKYPEAITAFRAASLAAPASSMALGNLGGEYLEIGDFAEAAKYLKQSLALEPNDLAAVNTSLALRYQGKQEEALPFAQQAVELNPVEHTNWLELGDCYSALHNRSGDAKNAYLRASKEVERQLQTDATNGPGWMLLALYRVKLGNPDTALTLIKKAESIGANDVDSQLYKARILELLGKRDEALATLAGCFGRGATALQVLPFPDLQALREDPRYLKMVQSKSTGVTETKL